MNNQPITTFYVVRHGETNWNAERKLQGHADIPLNENGEMQARNLAQELQGISFDLAISSDLLRAKKTAEIIALEHKLEVQTTNLLRDRNYGSLEGKPSQIFRDFDELLKELTHNERKTRRIAETIENDEELMVRIFTFLRETAITHPNKTVLMVSHGGILRTMLIHLGVFTYNDKFQVGNAGYIKIACDGVDFFVKETKGIEI